MGNSCRVGSSLWVGVLMWVLGACSPKAVVVPATKALPLPASEEVIVFKEDEPFEATTPQLGRIEIKDAGLAVNCSYDAVIQLAKVEARKLGANCIKIYEHRLPSPLTSNCHRIKAKAYHLADISLYEKEIIWRAQRKLKRDDFKGSTTDRPFAAATSSGIRYTYAARLLDGKGTVHIETYFDCLASYFKDSTHIAEILEHEQGHFDIAELYARQLTKVFHEQIHSQKELEQKHEALYKETMHELQIMQDKYDSEIYPNRKKQIWWNLHIQQDMERLREYESKEVRLSIR